LGQDVAFGFWNVTFSNTCLRNGRETQAHLLFVLASKAQLRKAVLKIDAIGKMLFQNNGKMLLT